ncbi:penicillin-binding transpeptidase domain-containing protein [Streptomyces sp. TS71-3]|uniref:penicillin-binding transpeptidase domain-containing protein n=1 Tax=Streptomyces sp. TS71-3 TaxID=2733862 RepID=UPI001B287F24|nr:penicillin-binding transpeptidase domain-containing protein [Streptomyces sp. TS71-3]GHJ35939.1 penicillin-binding protein [Streptomyces sp. TS71-3]
MTPHIRRSAALCAVLLIALLVNAARVQLVGAGADEHRAADRRPAIARYAQPRGAIIVDGRPVTGSRDTHQQLRHERTYLDGPLYAPVTGFASQLYGTSLLEGAEDAVLSGTEPRLAPLPLWHELTLSRSPGGRVVTTLDPAAQRAAFRQLAGRRGAVAAVDPRSGAILALVSSPSYDPGELSGNGPGAERAWRRLSHDPDQPMLSRATGRTYPPGSTFKVVTAAAALDAGTVLDVDAATRSPDPYRLPGTASTLTNEVPGCANASLRYAFTWSCNTVFARLGTRVGTSGMAAAARRFGFGVPGPRIPFGTAASAFGRPGDGAQLALSSIGQLDTRATPLEMAMVAAAVADDGVLRAPYLVDRATTAGGGLLRLGWGSRPPQRAMRPLTALRLRELMTGVVTNGTGTRAAIPGATVGGKTGTAEHGSGPPYAWFVAWAQPAGAVRPTVAVAVLLEGGAGGAGRAGGAAGSHRVRDTTSAAGAEVSGGELAAPIAKRVMEAVLPAR